MKKVLVIVALLSSNVQAEMVTANCSHYPTGNKVWVELLDQTIKAGDYATPAVRTHAMISSASYPMAEKAQFNITDCVADICQTNARIMEILPQGYIEDLHFNLKSKYPLAPGTYTAVYRFFIPRYGCDVTAHSTISVV